MKPREKGIQTMLDFTNTIDDKFKLPSHLDFGVKYEPTRFSKSKYVINTNTDEVLGIVGDGFKCASHPDFYDGVFNCITEQFSEDDVENAIVNFRTARNGAWSMLDISFPTNKKPICTNGMVTGDYDKVLRKNTSGFSLDAFITQLNKSQRDFQAQADLIQSWADTEFTGFNMHGVKDLLDDIVPSQKKAEKLYNLYMEETETRGHNKFALYSAFTNYASYADERNGFTLRSNGNDTQAVSMWQRENEVSKLVTNKKFLEYAVAA